MRATGGVAKGCRRPGATAPATRERDDPGPSLPPQIDPPPSPTRYCAHGATPAQRPLYRGHLSAPGRAGRSEEHTSELQSQSNLVCRLLLEKKKKHRDATPQVARES